MTAPILYFLYNKTETDTPYTGTGEETAQWGLITLSGTVPDIKVFTGGGINNDLPVPTAPYGSRDATIRPALGQMPIPQTYIESFANNIMTSVPLAGRTTNRYVFCVYVKGSITSDLYLEAWDDDSFASFILPVLSGTLNYSDSMVTAIATTYQTPNVSWEGTTLSGGWLMPASGTGVCLRGSTSRLRLKGQDAVEDEALYYNMYINLPYDAPLFHNQPVETFRYLYI
jgi:hypothetical protein